MCENFEEYLDSEIGMCEVNWNAAKEKIIRELETIKPSDANEYGAAYYSKIEALNHIAAKWEALAEAKRAYNYYKNK